MANTVIAVRSSSSTGNTPSLGVIANGELSLNFADGILYYKTASNTLGQIRTTQVSGSNQQVQFNDSGSFGSNSGFTFDKNTGILSAPIINVSTSYLQFADGTKQYTANAGSGGGSGNTYNIYNVNTQIFQATANGAQTTFSLGFTPAAQNNVIVTANGVVQYDYTVTGSTLTLNFTPPNNTLIRAQAIGISSANVLTPIFTTGNLISSNGNTLISSSVTEVSGNIGIGISLPTAKLDILGGLKISGSISEVMNTVTAAVGTTTLDLSTNSVYKLVMAANTTLAFSNAPSSGIERNFKLYANTNNGSNTITWPAAVKWQYGQAPTQTTTANKTDIYAFSTNDGGTTYFGYVSGLNF
jgi:hypothetical protein